MYMCYQAHSWPLLQCAIYSTLRAASSERRASSGMTIAVDWLSQSVGRSSSQSLVARSPLVGCRLG